MNSGWIKIWRKIEETSFYKDSFALHLAIHLIQRANHKPKKILFNGKEIIVECGQVVTGRDVLAFETGMTPSKIYRKLQVLQNLGFSNIKSNNQFSIITICKYRQYQCVDDKGEQQIEQRMNNGRTTDEHKQECKNVKNDKKGEGEARAEARPQSLADVKAFMKNDGEADKFWNHFSSNGWKVGGKSAMKDWKAAARNWMIRIGKNLNQPKTVSAENRYRDMMLKEQQEKFS